MNRLKTPLVSKPVIAVIILCICSFLIAVTYETYAFFISKDAVSNPFSVGENTSHIEESFGSYARFEKGRSYEKNVAVKNEGSVTCYVRVFAEIENPEIAAAVSVNFNNSDWTEKQPDGFYYYKKALMPGETTSPLFTALKAVDDAEEFEMICYSETVQAYGYSEPIKAFADI